MLALPPNTKFAFVGEKLPTLSRGRKFVAEISLEDRGWKRDILTVSEQLGTSRQVDKAEALQKRAESRFAETYRLVKVLQRRAKKFQFEETKSRDHRPKRDIISNDVNAAFFDGTPAIDAIAKLTFEGAGRWYDDIEGEPGPVPFPAAALFADSYPKRPGDPNKVLRAAAFAGWVISPLSVDRPIEEIGELILKYTRLE